DITSGGQDVPIALLDHPHGGVSDNQPVVWDGGNREPEKRYLGGGRTRYTFNAERLLYDSISWSYHLSNAVALNQAELQLREQRLPLFPNLNVDSDAVSHVVRLDSDVLRLTLTFQSETGATILDPRPLAEKYVEIRGENIWERVIDEERRCHVTAGSHTASL